MSEPLTLASLVATYEGYACPRERWRIGGEYERAVVRSDGACVPYFAEDGIQYVLAELRRRLGWAPYYEGANVIALEGDNASITLEPGGQVELSGAPFSRLGDLAAEVRANRDHLLALSAGKDHRWIAAGLTPYARIADIPFVPKGRYAVMGAYLPAQGDLAHWMMKGTCCVQANFDYADEEDCARKFEVALGLSPLNTAIFANSPLAEGRDTGFASYRGHVWTRTDPARTGFPPGVRAGYTHRGWVEYLLDVPMMFYRPGGTWAHANGVTFRQWMERGIDGHKPTHADWVLHQTSVFPEVRVKRTLEIRGADAVSLDLAIAFCALWTGLLYGALDDALDYTRGFVAAGEAAGESHEDRHLSSARHGLAGQMAGRSTASSARVVGELARAGLARIGEDVRLLDPLLERLAAGRSPAEDVREAFQRDPSPANVLSVLAY